jgi:hypothetical protein
MIYANGKGATRNFDLALKFVCEIDGARAENDYRFEHLLKLKDQRWTGDNFNLCDDATNGFMQGICASMQEKFARAERGRKLDEITSRWSPSEKQAFYKLQQAAKAFFDASSRNEVDLSGTGRAAFEIEANASLNDEFVAAVERFEKGHLPKFTSPDFNRADGELSALDANLQAEPGTSTIGTITSVGIKTAERAWLSYREAWVNFGQVKYPNVTPASWRTWLTQDRVRMLKGLT